MGLYLLLLFRKSGPLLEQFRHFPHIPGNIQCLRAVCRTASAADTCRRRLLFGQRLQTQQTPYRHIAVSQCSSLVTIVIVGGQERRDIQSLRAVVTAVPASGTGNRYFSAEYIADLFQPCHFFSGHSVFLSGCLYIFLCLLQIRHAA